LSELSPEAARLAGADEVGRGCLAGPLVTAAVVLDYRRDPARALRGLTDSKALTRRAREELYGRILAVAGRISLCVVSPQQIDDQGLHRSNLTALASCLERLENAYDLALVDGFELRRPDLRTRAVPQGDWRSAAIGAASIVAKVSRDRLMCALAADHPSYGFADHVGYATRSHQQALREHGPCVLHRRSFRTIALLLQGTLFEETDVPEAGPQP